jgi:hypothetical protein
MVIFIFIFFSIFFAYFSFLDVDNGIIGGEQKEKISLKLKV